MADTAQARLERLLYVLPTAARNHGATLAELAGALGVDEKTILRDLREAIERSDYLAAGAVETFTITLTDTHVTVHAPHHFNRPMRLNAREALALAVGLRTLAAEAEAGERGHILELAARLERELQTPAYPMRPLSVASDEVSFAYSLAQDAAPAPGYAHSLDEIEVELDDDEVRGRIARAIEQRASCVLTYLKPGAREPEQRRVFPQWLLYSNGQWHLLGYDYGRSDSRNFRIDRILGIVLEQPVSEPIPIEPRLPSGGFAFVGDDETEIVKVRYAPRVARWVAERTGDQLDHDGSLTLAHEVADPRWIVGHVLKYGADAEVLEPAWVRRLVHEAAERMAG